MEHCGLHCLKIEHIGVTLGGETLLRDVSLHAHCGELTALIGRNGAGKSTLLKAILGELPHTGKVDFSGHDGAPAAGKPRIGYVPQSLNLDRGSPATVYDLALAFTSAYPAFLPKSRRIERKFAEHFARFRACLLYTSTSYSLYADSLSGWFNENIRDDWSVLRGRLMGLLQEEAELEEIVRLVGMDALSAPDRLKLEAARSIREDYLHQNAFHDTDTYTSLDKQYLLMTAILGFYDKAKAALEAGVDIDTLVSLPARERIGRLKYAAEDAAAEEFAHAMAMLDEELDDARKAAGRDEAVGKGGEEDA